MESCDRRAFFRCLPVMVGRAADHQVFELALFLAVVTVRENLVTFGDPPAVGLDGGFDAGEGSALLLLDQPQLQLGRILR